METLVANLSGQTRHETLNGIEYIVAPVTMIVPGVLNGSQGPLFYPSEEIQRSVDSWNGMPVTIGHPLAVNGSFPSARTPEVQEKQSVGTLFNTRFVDGKLASDAYFDIKRTAKIDNRVLISLEKNQPIETSTGLFTKNEDAPESSHFQGTPYTHIARNYQPDHLAILLDQVGACSLQDGCGVLNKDAVENGKTFRSGDTSSNDGHIHEAIIDAQGFGLTSKASINGHIHEIREYRVLKSDGHTHKLQKKNLVDTGIPNRSIPDTYRSNNSEKESTMDEAQREEFIGSLIANSCCWNSDDKEFLGDMDDGKLKRFKAQADATVQNELVTNASKEPFKDEAGNEHTWNTGNKTWETKLKEEPVKNEDTKKPTEEPKPLTIEQLSPELQATIRNAQGIEQREKDGLIGKLVANLADESKPAQVERLQNRSLDDLRADLALLPPQKEETRAVDYSGAVGGGGGTPKSVTANFAAFGNTADYIPEEKQTA